MLLFLCRFCVVFIYLLWMYAMFILSLYLYANMGEWLLMIYEQFFGKMLYKSSFLLLLLFQTVNGVIKNKFLQLKLRSNCRLEI